MRGNQNVGSTLYLNLGGTFADVPIWVGPAESTTGVALGDVDGDGRLDLVRGNQGQGVTLTLNTGAGFAGAPAWTGPAADHGDVTLGDVDGDGDLDLVCGAGNGGDLYFNTGGTFAVTPSGPFESASSVALGDVDGDGLLDLVRGAVNRGATLFRNLGASFTSTPAWTGPVEKTYSLSLVDVNGDDRLDLVRGNSNQGATLSLNSGQSFAVEPAWTGPVENTISTAVGDVNGDGAPDLVRGNYGQATTLYVNAGGSFSVAPDWSGPVEGTSGVALGDVNDDGRIDLVRGNRDAGTFPGAGAVLHLNVAGTFAVAPDWTGPVENIFSVVLGDVDRDGDLDLVSGHGSGASLYLGTGGRLAATPASVVLAPFSRSVALGDVDSDGDLDLVRGNHVDGVTLHLNAGGSFAPTPAWTGLSEPTSSLALGDVDGDGDLDLVRGNAYQQGSTLYLNHGGSYDDAPAWTGPAGNTSAVALGDVDQDGDLDLVRGNMNEGSTLHLHKSPWLTTDLPSVPARHLVGNAAHLRRVRVAASAANERRISFAAVDQESDPLWVVGEYQHAGARSWHPMRLGGSDLRAGPFATSPGGITHEMRWDVTPLPFDTRDVVVRLRAVSAPRRGGGTQFIPSYLVEAGRVTPERPSLTLVPETEIQFQSVTIGDTTAETLRIENPGTRDLVIASIEYPTPDLLIADEQGPVTTPFAVPPGAGRSYTVFLTPRRPLGEHGYLADPLRILSNDPLDPVAEIRIYTEVRPLEFSSRLLAAAPQLPLGEAATVIVTPGAGVRVESGLLFHRARGAAAFERSRARDSLGAGGRSARRAARARNTTRARPCGARIGLVAASEGAQ